MAKSGRRRIFLSGPGFALALIFLGPLAQATPMLSAPPPTIHQLEYEAHRGEKPPVPPTWKRPRPLQPRVLQPNRTVYGNLPFWRLSSANLIRWTHLTHLAAFGVELDGNGNIVESNGWPGAWAAIVDSAHAHGVQVHLVAICFDADDIHAIVSDSVHTRNAIVNLLAAVEAGNADGVTVDFEIPYPSDSVNLTAFIQALADTFHAHGKEVGMDVLARNWGNRYQPQPLAEALDLLFVMTYDFHNRNSEESGPVAPLTGWGGYNVTTSIQYWVESTGGARDKIVLGVPYYGYKWPTATQNPRSPTRGTGVAVIYENAYYEAQTYGRRWDAESQTPWYRYFVNGDGWYQCWYDDDSSLGLKYDFALAESLQGIGIWALTYDGTRPELWDEIAVHFMEGAPPERVEGLMVTLVGPRRIKVQWYGLADAARYRVWESTDGENFTAVAETRRLYYLSDLIPPGEIRYYRVQATNPWGEGPMSEVLAAVSADTPNVVLVVNGFDRVSGTVNTFDFIRQHGGALHHLGVSFNSCSNERVEDSSVVLTDYRIVDWISGEEGTATMSFSPTEQARIKDFLENGGFLFVSGSEIGYDLIEHGSPEDSLFYHEYLKAEYVGDDAGTHRVQGVAGTIFDSLGTVWFDDGTHGTYDVDYPDGVTAYGGSTVCLRYVGGTGWDAGIQYEGLFGSGTVPGKLVYLGIPFETLYPASVRHQVMADVLRFFGLPVTVEEGPLAAEAIQAVRWVPAPGGWRLSFWRPLRQPFEISLYSTSGRRIRHERVLPPGDRLSWFLPARDAQGRLLPAGIYLLQMQGEGFVLRQKLLWTR